MEPVTLSINCKDYIGFDAAEVFKVCGQFRDLIKSIMSLPATEQEPAVGPKGEAAPTYQLPIHRCAECSRAAVEKPGGLCPACRESLERVGVATLPKSSAGAASPTPEPRALSSSSESARKSAHNGTAAVVLQAIRMLGEADVRAIVDHLGGLGILPDSDDPERTVANSIFGALRGQLEKVDGKRGFWRVAA